MNDRKRAVRYGISFVILAVLLIFLFIWNVNSGSIHLSVKEILNIIFRHQGDETSYNIVWEIRLPRILAVIILGGALSVSGFLLQTFFNNPIAGPFVLGISSGAKLIVALLMIFFLSRSVSIGSGAMILAAFAGSMISMGFVLLVAKKVHNMSMLVISGVMIGYICSAITDFVVTFADDSNIVNLHNWSLGSFSGMTWGNVQTMAVVVLLTMVIVFFMSKPISAYQLGETYAQNMVPVRSPHRSEKGILLFSSVRPLYIFYLYCMDASMLSSNLLVVYAQQFTNKTFCFYIKHTTKKDLDDVFIPTSSKSFLFYIIFSSITFSIRLFTSSASSVVCISLYSS